MNIKFIVNYMQASNYIGAENGIKMKALLSEIGFIPNKGNIRSFQRSLSEYRCNWNEKDGLNTFICSDPANGYYLAGNTDDTKRFIATQKSQAMKMMKTAEPINRYVTKVETEQRQYTIKNYIE